MKNSSEEAAWIARCVLWDDRRAFAHLVEKYQVRLRRFLLHLTGGDSYLADDLAQDTFVRAYERIRSYKGLSSFSTWLFRIACNLFYDYSRRMEKFDSIDSDEVAALSVEPMPVAEKIDVMRALGTLRPEERMALSLVGYAASRRAHGTVAFLSRRYAHRQNRFGDGTHRGQREDVTVQRKTTCKRIFQTRPI